MRLAITFGMCALLAACGGSSSHSGFSCDISVSGAHTCVDYSWSGGNYPTSSLASACTAASGTVVSACNHASAVGGCQVSATSGAITLKTLTWQYAGSASSEQSACMAESGTFVDASDGGGGGGDKPTTLSSGEMNEFVKEHNNARAAVMPAAATPLPNLAWDDAAAAVAVAYAEKCTFAHNPNRGMLGENLFANSGQSLTPTEVVDGWVSEKSDYDYATNMCADGKQCGHYTQVVWAATTGVGCALQICNTGSPFPTFQQWELWVCDYSPPGNYVGQKPY